MKTLESLEDWTQLKSSVQKKSELVLFKKSPICPVSFGAEEVMNRFLASGAESGEVTFCSVDVIGSRGLSQHIAAESGVGHQSPQVIWWNKEGEIKWSGSHHQISAENLNKCLS